MKLIPYFFALFFIISFHSINAQEDINELIKEATELATTANKQSATGHDEDAAKNFEIAAKKFEAAGMPAQANAERTNAGAAYDNAADKARKKKKHATAADLYGKAAQVYTKADRAAAAATSKRNKADSLDKIVVQNAIGTGNTTGHIATINVQNNGDRPLDIAPQVFFIPSDGKHQSYVGTTPSGIYVAVGQSANIPVHGYCVNIHTPPVPNNHPMSSIDNWIPVKPQTPTKEATIAHQTPEPMNTPPGRSSSKPAVLVTFGTAPMPAFSPSQISNLVNSRGFTPAMADPESTFISTWPGTDITLNGTIDPDSNPTAFAPLVVDIVTKIQGATSILQEAGALQTPLSANPEKERESVIQQTIWISMSVLTNEAYTKDDFTDNIYQQFEEKSSTSVGTLSDKNKEKIDEGVDDFWNSFTAVGIEAKVIKSENNGVEFGWFDDDFDYDKVTKKSDLPKPIKPKYNGYATSRALGKNHSQACKLEGINENSSFGKSFKRIYDNETKK